MLRKNVGKSLLLLAINAFAVAGYAQKDPLPHQIQSILDSYLLNSGKQEAASGVTVSISYPKYNKVIKQTFAAGKTSHDSDAMPVTKDTLFDIGSITKSYTTVLLLQLEAEGLLNINDPVGKWLPQYPMWKDVKIKQLLNMTSGIPNYSNDEKFSEFLENNLTADFTDTFLLSYAHPEDPITIGANFDYSNSNYILAGLIIEKITQQSFPNVLQDRLLKPLQLKDTYYAAGPNWKEINAITFPRKAHGYYYDYSKDVLMDLSNVNLSWGAAAGAIVSTTADQLKWIDALYHGKIFPAKKRNRLLRELKTVVSMKSGQPIRTVNKNDPMGFGLGVGLAYDSKQRFWFYEGSTLGFRMLYIWKPCNDVSVIAALNSKGGEGDHNSPVGDHIKDIALGTYQKILENNPGLICKD